MDLVVAKMEQNEEHLDQRHLFSACKYLGKIKRKTRHFLPHALFQTFSRGCSEKAPWAPWSIKSTVIKWVTGNSMLINNSQNQFDSPCMRQKSLAFSTTSFKVLSSKGKLTQESIICPPQFLQRHKNLFSIAHDWMHCCHTKMQTLWPFSFNNFEVDLQRWHSQHICTHLFTLGPRRRPKIFQTKAQAKVLKAWKSKKI